MFSLRVLRYHFRHLEKKRLLYDPNFIQTLRSSERPSFPVLFVSLQVRALTGAGDVAQCYAQVHSE